MLCERRDVYVQYRTIELSSQDDQNVKVAKGNVEFI